jgi:alpha-L-fucosidase
MVNTSFLRKDLKTSSKILTKKLFLEPDFQYGDFAKDFKAEFFDPDAWSDIFNSSGAKYIVLTSKHHEGML